MHKYDRISKMIYLDNAATAIPLESIWQESYTASLQYFANPSSRHAMGKESLAWLNNLRQELALLCNVTPKELIFTSGATEANQLLLNSLLTTPSRGTILWSAAEHPSIYENRSWLLQAGYQIKEVRVNSLGQLDLSDLKKKLEGDVRLLCCMVTNYQSGAINNLAEITKILREYADRAKRRAIHLHLDAAQWLGGNYANLMASGADSIALSGHKLGGPKGAGLLYLARPRHAFLRGGGQEYGFRSGTENLFAITGLARAMQHANRFVDSEKEAKQELLYRAVIAAGGEIYHLDATVNDKSFYHHLVRFAPLPAEIVLRVLADHGIMVGTNSACAGSNNERLRALLAQGFHLNEAGQILRLSYAPWTPLNQLEAILEHLPRAIATIPR